MFAQDIIEYNNLNTAVDKGATCASACSMLWAAGIERRVDGGRIGLHQASVNGRGVGDPLLHGRSAVVTIGEIMRISMFLQSRGAPFQDESVNPAFVTPHDQIHWLTPAEIAAWNTVPIAKRQRFGPLH
jgi:hypothetical protein